MPLAHAGAEEAVEVLGAHASGPAVERPGGGDFVHGGEVGLANPGGAVAVLPQDLEHGGGAARDAGVVSREPDRGLRDGAHADGMAVAPGEQRGTRRGTHGRGVKVGEAQPLLRQPVERRRIRRPAERAHVAVADVIAHDEQHVGRALRRPQRLGPIGLRVFEGHLDRAPERRVGGRQHGPVECVGRWVCGHGRHADRHQQPKHEEALDRGHTDRSSVVEWIVPRTGEVFAPRQTVGASCPTGGKAVVTGVAVSHIIL